MSDLIADLFLFQAANITVASTEGGSVPQVGEGWFDGSGIEFGVVDDTLPISLESSTFGGVILGGANSMLYGRIYVTPGIVDVGNLLSIEFVPAFVWNAQFETADVEDVLITGEGIGVVEPNSTPYSLAPLQEVFYEISVSSEGPATVDGSMIVTVDGDDYTIKITGSRASLWPFEPQWESPFEESITFHTTILRKRRGSEQRRSWMQVARRGVSYEPWVSGPKNTQWFDSLLFGWQNRPFAVPLAGYKHRLTAPLLVGATTIPMSTDYAGFSEGQTIVVLEDVDRYEIAKVESVAGDHLALDRPLASSWGLKARIYPLMTALIEGNVPVTRATSRHLSTRVVFAGVPQVVDPYLPTLPPEATYNGRELVLRRPNWAGGMDNSSSYENSVVDYRIGPIDLYKTEELPMLSKRCSWWLKGREEIYKFRGFLNRVKGRWKSFYIPSWHEDLTVIQDITSLDSTIVCSDNGFFRLVGVHPSRAHIMIRTRTHGDFIRPISSLGLSGSMNVGIGTALGVDVPRSDIRQVHFLGLYRFSSDIVTLQWRNPQFVIVDAVLMLVEA